MTFNYMITLSLAGMFIMVVGQVKGALPKKVILVANKELTSINEIFSERKTSSITCHSKWSEDCLFKIEDCDISEYVSGSGEKIYKFKLPSPVRSFDFIVVYNKDKPCRIWRLVKAQRNFVEEKKKIPQGERKESPGREG